MLGKKLLSNGTAGPARDSRLGSVGDGVECCALFHASKQPVLILSERRREKANYREREGSSGHELAPWLKRKNEQRMTVKKCPEQIPGLERVCPHRFAHDLVEPPAITISHGAPSDAALPHAEELKPF